jgi:hypothetical protein
LGAYYSQCHGDTCPCINPHNPYIGSHDGWAFPLSLSCFFLFLFNILLIFVKSYFLYEKEVTDIMVMCDGRMASYPIRNRHVSNMVSRGRGAGEDAAAGAFRSEVGESRVKISRFRSGSGPEWWRWEGYLKYGEKSACNTFQLCGRLYTPLLQTGAYCENTGRSSRLVSSRTSDEQPRVLPPSMESVVMSDKPCGSMLMLEVWRL